MTVLLTSEDGLTLELDDCAAGYLVTSVEVGAPEVRAVVDPRPLADGVVDRTRYVGARAITVNLMLAEVPNARRALLDAIGPFLHPARRSTLTIGQAGWGSPRLYNVRADDFSAPWENPHTLTLALSWRTTSASPFGLSATEHSATITPSESGELGRNYYEREATSAVRPLNLMPSDAQASVEAGTTTPGANLGTGTWSIWGGAQTVARDPTVSRHGASSLAMARSTAGAAQGTPNPPGATGVYRFPLLALHRYQVLWSAMVEASAADKRAQIGSDIRDAAAASLGTWSRNWATPGSAGGVWDDRASSFVVPPGGVDAYLNFTSVPTADTGKWWLDRVAVYDEGLQTWELPSLSAGRNVLTDQQASIEGGATTGALTMAGWRTGTAGTLLSRSTAQAYAGASSLKVERSAATGTPRVSLADDAGVLARVPVVAGNRYAFSLWLYRTGMASALSHNMVFNTVDAGGAFVADVVASINVPVAANGQWWPVYGEFVAPANAAQCTPQVDVGNITTTDPAYLDAFTFGPASEPLPFYLPSQADPGSATGEWGRAYARRYPDPSTTVVPVVNAGDAPASWVATVHGPINGFTLTNTTTGEHLAFPSLNVPAGQTVVIDQAAHTVLADGDPGSSRYEALDFATSTWFPLVPGPNALRVLSATYSASAQTVVTWRDAYMA